jgi:AAA domain/Primase C terminal 2 (PriCT-2)
MSAPDAKMVAPAPPRIIPPNFENMPSELKAPCNWVLWVLVWNGSKWTKRPIQPSGFGASTTNPKHWSSFEDVKQAHERAVERGYIELREKDKPVQKVPVRGVGFVFDGKPDEDGFVFAGVDFDNQAFSGEIASLSAERVKRLGSYVEASPSGKGIHVIVKARPLKSGISHNGTELYTSGRFFTMTGQTGNAPLPIVTASEAFATLANELHEAGQKASASTDSVVPLEPPDWAIEGRPADAFVELPFESLAKGLEPNIEEIRSAAAAIPASAIATEPEWMNLARALAHTAAIHKDYTEPLWEVLDAVSRRAPSYNKDDNRRRFERYISEALNRSDPITLNTLYHMALHHGWDGRVAPANATAVVNTAHVGSTRAVHISNLPVVPAKRQWLHGNDLIRGAVTVLVAPGGRAKSTWLLACALACASGRPLLGSHVFGGPLRVLCLSTEDGLNEIALRLRAAMKHFGLTDADVPGLDAVGADRWGLPLLRAENPRAIIDARGINALVAELDYNKMDVLIIDPLINVMGGINVNDNAAAALLMGQLVDLASTRRMAVALAHHVSKGRDPTSAESAMGAASFINLARVALSIEPLEPTKAGEIGLPSWEAGSVFRLIPTKQNFSPPSAKDRWFRLATVDMPNAEPPIYVTGDQVAVVEPFVPGSSGPAFPDALVRDALRAVDTASPPLTPSRRSADRYAAPVIAEAIKSHRSGQVSEVDGKAVLDHLMRAGLVVVADVKVPRGGKGSDTRKGLVLTPDGKVALQQTVRVAPSDPSPQSPQSPATKLQGDAGGDPLGSPATQGGCGGNAGGNANAVD